MNTLAPLLPASATVDDARALLASRPDIAAYIGRIRDDRSNKCRFRVPMEKVYAPEVVDYLLPKLTGGRPPYEGEFSLLSSIARRAVSEAVGTPIAGIDWTPENASRAADALVLLYPNPTSASMALKSLRAGIVERLGLDIMTAKEHPSVAATYRADVTRAHNSLGAARLEARIGQGLTLPPPYERIALLSDRAREFIAAPAPTPQAAADLLVILSARPGEAETLKIGDRGAVTGALKKRGKDVDAQYNIVSSLGEAIASEYLEAWRALPAPAKRAAMTGLTRLAAQWGIQRRDLRAIGAALAVRAELLAGNIHNAAEGRTIHAAALRHAVPERPAAQVHYERVTDPAALIAAQISELAAEDLDAVLSLLEARRASRVK